MTDESICVRCAEMIRLKADGIESRICPVEGIRGALLAGDTVEECSRFVQVPGETASAAKAMGEGMSTGTPGTRSPRPRYLPHGKEG